MKKNVLAVCSSPRKGGNCETLMDAFLNCAREAGHNAEKMCLYDKNIGFCRGCLVCQKTQRCVIHDDADWIARRMKEADVLVFATPIYYYEMSGQMKTMLDRANPLFPSDYHFRDVYLIATAAETEHSAMDRAQSGLEGWIECFEKARLAGTVFGGGAETLDAMQNSPALQLAREMGRKI